MLKGNKPIIVKEIQELAGEHKVIGILNMHKMPARQLQQMRDSLRGKAQIRMTKKTLMKKALDEKMHEKLDGNKMVPALLFSNENPFRLYKMLKENRTPAAAKPGDVAPKDIVIQKGPTPLAPGPAISTLQKVGLKSSVQDGKIAVMQDKVVCKEGEVVSEDLAGVLNLLKIEPMEIGLDLVVVHEEGVAYEKKVLDVDQEQYITNMQRAVQEMVNLSLNTGYIVKETGELALQKAFTEAKTLAIEANIIEKEFIDEVMAKAAREAMALEEKTGKIESGTKDEKKVPEEKAVSDGKEEKDAKETPEGKNEEKDQTEEKSDTENNQGGDSE